MVFLSYFMTYHFVFSNDVVLPQDLVFYDKILFFGYQSIPWYTVFLLATQDHWICYCNVCNVFWH